MSIKAILQRAEDTKRRYDHIGWRGICRRCGLSHNFLGQDIYKKYKDAHIDMREQELECKSPRCKGRVVSVYRMGEQRALHLCDIGRRTE